MNCYIAFSLVITKICILTSQAVGMEAVEVLPIRQSRLYTLPTDSSLSIWDERVTSTSYQSHV